MSPAGGSRDGSAEGHRGPVVRALDAAVASCAVVGMLWIAVLMLVMNVDIFGRYMLNRPLTGTAEFVQISVSSIVFLLLPHTVRAGRMTQVTLLMDVVRASRPGIALALDRSFLVLGAATYAGLAWWTWPRAVQAYERGSFIGSEGVFRLVEWPVFTLVCVGSALAALSALSRLRRPEIDG